jgi:hypothetical protein
LTGLLLGDEASYEVDTSQIGADHIFVRYDDF